MERVELSICIPTYERYLSLKRLLEQLLPQCEGKNVEVIVSDNASQDATRTYCTDLSNNSLKLRYYNNTVNEGFAKNILRLLQLANGKFIWIIGDDDQVSLEAVSSILGFIEKEDVLPSVVLANFCRIGAERRPEPAKPEFNLECNRSGASIARILEISGIWSSLMSITIMNGDLARFELGSLSDYKSDYLAFSLAMRVASHGNCAILAQPLVYRRKTDQRILEHRFLDPRTYLVDFLEPLSWARSNGLIHRSLRNRLMGTMYRGIGGFALIRAITRNRAAVNGFSLVKANYMIPQFWIFLVPILILPRFVILQLVRSFRGIFNVVGAKKQYAIFDSLLR